MAKWALPLAFLGVVLPAAARASNYRKATTEELHSAYCLEYFRVSGPTEAQLSDPSINDAYSQNLLALRQKVMNHFERVLGPVKASLDPTELAEQSKMADDDWAYMNAPRKIDPSKVMDDSVIKRALTCTK